MPESADPDPDVTMAKFLALGVRNGVEDLHAGGMFGDDWEDPELSVAFKEILK